ncbi:MAG: tetratricopeptide repeat protein [Nostocaceae cyanobacterium]|nr:tetratricopeptide repeat protein [Nostocaceae cyanobacterium]
MANAEEKEYIEARTKRIQRKNKILAIVSLVSFAGSGLFTVVPALQKALSQDTTLQAAASAETASLQKQRQGYELVLQREPNNKVALEGLVKVKLQLKDGNGAITALEKLKQSHPEREDYKVALADLKKRFGKSDR